MFWNRWFKTEQQKRDERLHVAFAIMSAETYGFGRGLEWAKHQAEHGCPPPENDIERAQRMEQQGLCSAESCALSIASKFLKG